MKITIATFQEMGGGEHFSVACKAKKCCFSPASKVTAVHILSEGRPAFSFFFFFFFSFLMKQIKPHSCNANLTHHSPPLPSSRFCSSEVDQAKMTLLNLQSKKLGFERENWPKADWKLVVKPVPKPRSPESLVFSFLSLS